MKQNILLVALCSQPHVQIKIPLVTINNSLYLLFPLPGTLCHWVFPGSSSLYSGPSPEDASPARSSLTAPSN